MFKVSNKLYSFVALFYVFLSILGYQLATTILLPLSSDAEVLSTAVTYPYRALVFVLAFFLIVASPQKRKVYSHKKMALLYVIFMGIYFIRILIDVFVRHIYVEPSWRSTVLQYMFVVVIPAIWAIMRCVHYIDYQKLNRWLFGGGLVLLVALIMNQNTLIQIEYDEMIRGESNVAMGSLNLGYSCVVVFLISFSMLFSKERNKGLKKILIWLVMLVSFVIMLRAASRGPLVTLTIILILFLFSRIKNKAVGAFVSILVIACILVNLTTILNFLGEISPLMEKRMLATINESDASGRDVKFAQAVNLFYQNPFIGEQFVLPDGFYSHNSILDVMIGLGFLGTLIWVYIIIVDFKKSYYSILSQSSLMTISILSLMYIIESFFSGAMYISAKIAICLIIVLSLKLNEE